MIELQLQFPDINPVAFSIFGFDIMWYAITYLIGFTLAYFLMRRRLQHEPFRSITKPKPYSIDDIDSILFAAILGVLIGGRVGYALFYKPSYYLQHPLEIVTGIRSGGMSFHGGVIGVIVALLIWCLMVKRPFLQVTDLLVPAVPLGLASGRIGNFINGELWGRPAPDWVPWRMIFPDGGDVARHPSQIYQALLEGVLLFIVLWIYARKPRYRGQVSAAFLIGYGVFRSIGEHFREPDAHLGFLTFGLTMGQILCIPMIVIGVGIWIWAQRTKPCDIETPDDTDPETEPAADAEAPGEATDTEADAEVIPTVAATDGASTDSTEALPTADESARLDEGPTEDPQPGGSTRV